MIFISSPYNHPDADVRLQRFKATIDYNAQLLNKGLICFSPIVYGHTIAVEHKLPTDWEFWNRFCSAFLKNSKKMHVLCLPGWEESTGIKEEIKIAEIFNIPIIYVNKF